MTWWLWVLVASGSAPMVIALWLVMGTFASYLCSLSPFRGAATSEIQVNGQWVQEGSSSLFWLGPLGLLFVVAFYLFVLLIFMVCSAMDLAKKVAYARPLTGLKRLARIPY